MNILYLSSRGRYKFSEESSKIALSHEKQNVLGSDVGKGAFLVTLTQPDAKKNGEMQAKMKNMVKNTKVLAYVRDVPESYKNCEILFSLLNLKSIIAKYSLDNKLININRGPG